MILTSEHVKQLRRISRREEYQFSPSTLRQMISKFRIAVLGLGGVGGYFGGKLAAHYSDSKDIEIIFIARGENEKAIKSNGLKLITSQGEQIVHPSQVTSQPEQLGLLDLIICCVKSYDLETGIMSLKPCINEQTIILPLLNGVDASDRIKNILPQAEVWGGCVYIVSRRVAPGVVKESGGINQLHFGSEHAAKEKLDRVHSVFRSAGINANLSANITQTLWEKFLFISPSATLTSYLDLNIGTIIGNSEHRNLLLNLLKELKGIAEAKNISLSENIIQKLLDKMASLPPETTSSMHSDFKRGSKTEVDSLTDYVVKLGRELNVPTPWYEQMLAELKEKLVR
jgi:2-dehydropantoate 2-reductase